MWFWFGSSRNKLDGEWEWGVQAKRAIKCQCQVRAEVELSGLFYNETRILAPALIDQWSASHFVSVLE